MAASEFAEPRQDHHRGAGHGEAQQQAADELAQEDADRGHRTAVDGAQRIAARPRRYDADEQTERGDGDGVVQQRLAFGQDRQPLGRADIAEDADDRRRVGGRHDRAQQQADHEVDAGGEMDDAGHAGDAHQHRHDGQQQHGMDFVHQAPHVDGEAGGEQQRRQEQRQEHVGADLELVEADEDVAQRPQLEARPR